MAHASPQRARWQATLASAATLVLWWRMGGMIPAAIAGLAGSLALLAWVSPPRYAPIQRFLDRIVRVFVAALTWLILALIYLGLFTPLRLWRALRGQDPLGRRADPAASTYLRPLPPAAPGRFDRQF